MVIGSQFGETAYISQINRNMKNKSGSHEQELGPRSEMFSLGVAGADGVPNSNNAAVL